MLFSQFKVGKNGPVAVDVGLLEVVEKFLSLSDQLQQSLLRGEVLLVAFEMLSKVVDPVCEQSNLSLWGTGVFFLLRKSVLLEKVLFCFSC